MKAPKVKFSYNYSRGSALYRSVKSKALSEKLFHEYLYLYGNKDSLPLKTITQKFKAFMPEPIYFDIKKIPIEELDMYGATSDYYINNEGDLRKYRILLPADGNSLLLENLPNLIHEATHLFDSLLQPKTLQSYKKIFTNQNHEKIEEFFEHYLYNGDNTLMAKNTKISNIKRQTKKFLRKFSVKEKISILNFYRERMQSELSAYRLESDCNQKLKRKIKNKNFWSFEDIDNLYHFEDKINLLNKMIYRILLKERYKMALDKADSPMDKLKLTLGYCFKSII